MEGPAGRGTSAAGRWSVVLAPPGQSGLPDKLDVQQKSQAAWWGCSGGQRAPPQGRVPGPLQPEGVLRESVASQPPSSFGGEASADLLTCEHPISDLAFSSAEYAESPEGSPSALLPSPLHGWRPLSPTLRGVWEEVAWRKGGKGVKAVAGDMVSWGKHRP